MSVLSDDLLKRSITRTSLADAAYDRLLEAIVSGALPSGAELSAVALASSLNVSRTPVQEALRRLESDGLVRYTAARKAVVARFDRGEIAEIYELRTILESAAAERAAVRIDLAALADLRARADRLDPPDSGESWAERALAFDVDFHDAIALASGNAHLRDQVGRYRRLVRGLCRITAGRENLCGAFREHLRILDALEARDPAAAREAMADHIRARLAGVLEAIGRASS